MPDTSKLSKYLKADSVKDGDIINFIDAGVILDREFKKDGKTEIKPVLEITVEVNGDKKTYSPNGTTIALLNKAWGKNTEKWVGRQAKVFIMPSSNGKDMIVAKPVLKPEEVTDPEDIEFGNK